jgi:hypothetical protein
MQTWWQAMNEPIACHPFYIREDIMLTSTAANLLTNKINKAFDSIGKGNGTSMPESARNMDALAWDLHVATHLARMADARKVAAMKQATSNGVIPDYKNEPRKPGTNETVYSGDVVAVQLSVKNGRAILDTDGFINALLNSGVDRDLVTELAMKHTKSSSPAHSLTTTLITDNN